MRQGISNPRKIFNEGKVKEFGVLVKGKKYVQFSQLVFQPAFKANTRIREKQSGDGERVCVNGGRRKRKKRTAERENRKHKIKTLVEK